MADLDGDGHPDLAFRWDLVQRRPDGKVLLLYRHERIFLEGLVKPGDKVVDVGGWGMLAQRLIEEGCDTTILDLFTEDQQYATRVCALPHVIGDVCDPDCFAAGSLNAVTCFETLEHVGSIRAAVESIYGWLKPSGVFVGTVPIPDVVHHTDESGIAFISASKLAKLLRKVGFVNVRTAPTPSVNAGDDLPTSIYFRAWRSPGPR